MHKAPLLPTSRFRNEYRIPFRPTPLGHSNQLDSWQCDPQVYENGFRLRLRIDSPMCKYCSHGTLLHVGPQGSHLSICYYHQDLCQWRLQAGSRPNPSTLTTAPSYSLKHKGPVLVRVPALLQRSSIGRTLKRHPFSGLVASAGELLHTP
jgi:hypothetical protein